MSPAVASQIQRLRWIAETEHYLARARAHIDRCPDDAEAAAVIRTVDDALTKARAEVGVPVGHCG
jgi:hypothetical protein